MFGRTSLAATLAISLVPAVAAAQAHVWISSGKDLRQVTTSGNSVGSSKSVHLSTATAVGHLAYGPDGRLYFGEHFPTTACISRIDPAGNVSRQTGANATYAQVFCDPTLLNELRQLRFDWTGALLFATTRHGVKQLAASCVQSTCSTSTSVATPFAGSGVTNAIDGVVLYSDGVTIKRTGSTVATAVDPFVALDVITGGPASLFPGKSTGAICGSAGNSIPCFKAGSAHAALYTFAWIDKAQGGALAKDDTAWWATSVDPSATLTSGQAPHNGLLWRITGTGATIIYPTRFNGPQPPIVGVALPLTSKTITDSAPTDTHNFDFGTDVVTFVTPLACKLAVTALERFKTQVQSCLDSTNLTLSPTPYLGESFFTEYDVTVLSGPCFTSGSLADAQIAAYFAPGENLALIRRPTGAPSGSNTCTANTTGQYLLGPLPEDAVTRGSINFSAVMGAQVGQPSQLAAVTLLPPLQGAPVVTTNPTQDDIDDAVAQNLGNIAVKFSLTRGGSIVTTRNAVFSVQRLGTLNTSGQLEPDSQLCTVQPQDAVTGPPTFFVTSENTHRFNLNTSAMAPPACTQRGLYAFGISFPVDGIADPVTFLVELK
jgi:hypothetical protein